MMGGADSLWAGGKGVVGHFTQRPEHPDLLQIELGLQVEGPLRVASRRLDPTLDLVIDTFPSRGNSDLRQIQSLEVGCCARYGD